MPQIEIQEPINEVFSSNSTNEVSTRHFTKGCSIFPPLVNFSLNFNIDTAEASTLVMRSNLAVPSVKSRDKKGGGAM